MCSRCAHGTKEVLIFQTKRALQLYRVYAALGLPLSRKEAQGVLLQRLPNLDQSRSRTVTANSTRAGPIQSALRWCHPHDFVARMWHEIVVQDTYEDKFK